jgi:hypothetical protein
MVKQGSVGSEYWTTRLRNLLNVIVKNARGPCRRLVQHGLWQD